MTEKPAKFDMDREGRLDAAFAEYLELVDRQEDVDPERFVERFGDLAEELLELLSTVGRVEQMAGPRVGDEPEEDFGGANAPVEGIAETRVFSPNTQALASAPSEETQTDVGHRRFGDYVILRQIGQGGMGVVYMARQVSLDRLVAVKMIRSRILASKEDVRRFHIEARAAGKLSHPNVVSVHQVGEIAGQHFYTMEYVDGVDLAVLSRSGTVSAKKAARYVKEIAEGIQHAHEHGIIHRDLKPANVIVDANDHPRVSDFGLAKDFRREHGLTESGTSVGTPSYMSPEQAAARVEEVAAATDIYSLGAILYELLTGRPPFRADSTVDTLLDVIHNEPTSPKSVNRRVDKRIEAICLKCLSKDPARRYESARDLADDLERYLNGDPVLARPVGRVMKCWYWLRDVPLIAAVVGRRFTTPTAAHRRVQWMAVALAAGLVLWGAGAWWAQDGQKPFPKRVRIASGSQQGEYHAFGAAFRQRLAANLEVPIEVVVTGGTVDNRERLLAEQAELGLLQASAISSDVLAVAAPLYPEALYFVVRTEDRVGGLHELASEAIVIGGSSSGMQLSARRVFDQLAIEPEFVETDFSALPDHPEWAGAVVTTGPQNDALKSLLLDDRFCLLSLTDGEIETLVGPLFRPVTIDAGALREGSAEGAAIPAETIRTVATTTFLVVRRDTAGKFVETLLETLYGSDDLNGRFGTISRKRAAQWPALPLHPAAREYYRSAVHGRSM